MRSGTRRNAQQRSPRAKGAPTCITGSVLKKNHPNVMGLDFAANESGCLVGYLAAEMAKPGSRLAPTILPP